MSSGSTNPVTQLLVSASQGDSTAQAKLWMAIHDELHRLAHNQLAAEGRRGDLRTTVLVHEAYLRLLGGQAIQWESSAQFFTAAAEAMRRILVEAARRKGRLKHGGGRGRQELDEADAIVMPDSTDLIDLDEALDDLSKSRVPVFYIVDSFGAMYSEQVEALVKKCAAALPGKTLGFHGHNNQQLAFANTIEAIIRNCNRLDGSLYGIGRGAGNCPIELLMAFLKNPKFDLRPVLAVIQSHLLPLRKSIEWGYHIPYLITGALNEHPRSAMKFMAGAGHNDFVKFYDQMTEVTPLE